MAGKEWNVTKDHDCSYILFLIDDPRTYVSKPRPYFFSGMMFAEEGTNSLLKGVNLSSAQNNPTVIAESCLLTTHCCVQFPNWVSECPIPSPTSATTNPHACLRKICKVTENCFQIVECECKIKSTLHPQVCLSEVQGQESAKSQTTVYGIILYTTSILYPVTTVKLARVLL